MATPSAAKAGAPTAGAVTESPRLAKFRSDTRVFAAAVAGQQARLQQLETIETQKALVRDEVDSEKLNFREGGQKLQALAADADLLEHQRDRRGTDILADWRRLRDEAIRLKGAAIWSLRSAAAVLVEKRQAEVQKLALSWGGTVPAGAATLPAAIIIDADPSIQELVKLQEKAEHLSLRSGAAEILKTLAEVEKAVSGIPARDPAEPLYGGHTEDTGGIIKTWNGRDRHFDTYAEFSNEAEARDAFHALRLRSGVLDAAGIILFPGSKPENTHVFNSAEIFRQDHNDNLADCHSEGACGRNPDLLTKAAEWAAGV